MHILNLKYTKRAISKLKIQIFLRAQNPHFGMLPPLMENAVKSLAQIYMPSVAPGEHIFSP